MLSGGPFCENKFFTSKSIYVKVGNMEGKSWRYFDRHFCEYNVHCTICTIVIVSLFCQGLSPSLNFWQDTALKQRQVTGSLSLIFE